MSSCWDFLVIGAGASGCVVAARLAQSPKVRVSTSAQCTAEREILLTFSISKRAAPFDEALNPF